MSLPRAAILFLFAALGFPPAGLAQDKSPQAATDARREALLKAGYTAVPMVAEPTRWVIEGRIGETKSKLLLDTGGMWTLIDEKVAKSLKLEPGEKYSAAGVAGSFSGHGVTLPLVKIGDLDVNREHAPLAGFTADLSRFRKGVDGVIGLPLLESLSAVIDYPASTLYLRTPVRTMAPRLAGRWEVTRWEEDGAARALDPKAPPLIEFADNRLKWTDGGSTREFAVHLMPDGDRFAVGLFNPKYQGELITEYPAGGLLKVADGKMTACLFLDADKVKGTPTQFDAPKGSGFVLLELKDTVEKRKPPEDPLGKFMGKDGYTAVPLEREADGERVVTAKAGEESLRLFVDTGAAATVIEGGRMKKLGGSFVREVQVVGVGGAEKGGLYRLRGLRLGDYDSRTAAAQVFATTADLSAMNKGRAADKKKPLDGLLGHADLRNGSAVIDLRANALYLRPLKKTLLPQLEGKWVAVGWQFDGQSGRYGEGERPTAEFTADRHTLSLRGEKDKAEWGYQVIDDGRYLVLGLHDPKKKETADDFAWDADCFFRLKDGKLHLLKYNLTNAPPGPPAEFAAAKGNGYLLLEFERAK